MADREDNVYQAKLAEQAERYDGNYLNFTIILFLDLGSVEFLSFLVQ